jgi:hypothetical protein
MADDASSSDKRESGGVDAKVKMEDSEETSQKSQER